MLGYWVRRLADGGLAAALTATSPPRLAHPDGGDPLVGTTPLAIAVPSSDGKPLVADVSMGKVTYGDVIAGHADAADLVPFGGEQAHKAFALAAGLQLLVEALGVETHGALLVVARPEADPVPAFRALAAGLRLPGDSWSGARSSSSSAHLRRLGIELERSVEVSPRVVDVTGAALDAGEVVVARPLTRRTARASPSFMIRERSVEACPRRHAGTASKKYSQPEGSNALPGFPPMASTVVPAPPATAWRADRRVREEDERPCGCVDTLAVRPRSEHGR